VDKLDNRSGYPLTHKIHYYYDDLNLKVGGKAKNKLDTNQNKYEDSFFNTDAFIAFGKLST